MAVKKMHVTSKLIATIETRLTNSNPSSYKVALQFVVPHGAGIVVGYVVQDERDKLSYRSAGFLPHEGYDDGLQCKYDMIV